MKLKNDFFTIQKSEPTASGASFLVRLNPESVIYKAHFPGRPITPGVCIVEMAVELLEEQLQHSFSVQMIKNLKFLAVISPEEVQEIIYDLKISNDDNGLIKTQVVVSASDKVYAKLTLICNPTTNK